MTPFAPFRMYLAAFLLDFAVAIGFAAMPFFIFDHLGGGSAFSGTVGAIQMALYALSCLLSARFIARTVNGLRWALAGVTIFALFFTVVPWGGGPIACGVMASLPFVGLALAWPAMQSWLGGEPDPVLRARHLTGFNTATAFGFTLGPLMTGPLYDLDYRLPFGALFAVCAAVAALLYSLPPETTFAQGRRDDDAESGAAEDVPNAAGLLLATWAATFAASGLMAAVRSVYPMQVDTLVKAGGLALIDGVTPEWLSAVGPATAFSWLAFLLSLATVACFAIMGNTTRWQGRFGFLITSQILAAGAFIGLGQTQSLAVMMLCFALVGANFGLCFFASLYYSLASAAKKHRRAAINEGLLGAGGFVGGIGVGYLAEAAGVSVAFQWAPLFVGLAIAVQLILLRKHAAG